MKNDNQRLDDKKSSCKIENYLKHLCGRPSPGKRLIVILFLCVALAVASIYYLVCSISGIDKNDAVTKQMKVKHIEKLNFNNKKNEYEPSSNDGH